MRILPCILGDLRCRCATGGARATRRMSLNVQNLAGASGPNALTTMTLALHAMIFQVLSPPSGCSHATVHNYEPTHTCRTICVCMTFFAPCFRPLMTRFTFWCASSARPLLLMGRGLQMGSFRQMSACRLPWPISVSFLLVDVLLYMRINCLRWHLLQSSGRGKCQVCWSSTKTKPGAGAAGSNCDWNDIN